MKILAGIGTLVIIVVTTIIFMTAGMSDTADKFFIAVKSNNYDAAYSFLSEDFKKYQQNTTQVISINKYTNQF